MPITPNQPAAITRFFAPGVTEILFCPSIANKAAPTFAELDAGTDLTRDVADISGWMTTSAMIDTPDLKTRFVSQIPGRITAEESSITFYSDVDRGAGDVSSLLPRDTDGYIVIADGGLASAIGDAFQVTVSSNSMSRSLDNAGQRVVKFAIRSEPAEGVTLPQS
jgi:hypothetical protein